MVSRGILHFVVHDLEGPGQDLLLPTQPILSSILLSPLTVYYSVLDLTPIHTCHIHPVLTSSYTRL